MRTKEREEIIVEKGYYTGGRRLDEVPFEELSLNMPVKSLNNGKFGRITELQKKNPNGYLKEDNFIMITWDDTKHVSAQYQFNYDMVEILPKG